METRWVSSLNKPLFDWAQNRELILQQNSFVSLNVRHVHLDHFMLYTFLLTQFLAPKKRKNKLTQMIINHDYIWVLGAHNPTMEMNINWYFCTYQILFHHAVLHFLHISMAIVILHVKIMLRTAVNRRKHFTCECGCVCLRKIGTTSWKTMEKVI